MIKGIIFDCFGVLARGSLTYFSSLTSPENQGALRDINGQADLGLISHQSYVSAVAELANVPVEVIERAFRERHVVDVELLEYARSLKPQYKVAMLSNVGHDVIDRMFSAEDLTGLFDAVVLSAEVGVAKPDPRIYEMTALRLGLLPEECIMIDDIEVNVDGAVATGMKGILYTSMEQAKLEILELTKNA